MKYNYNQFRKVILLSILFYSCTSGEYLKEINEDGIKVSEGHVIDGKKIGNWIYYNSNSDTTFVRYYNLDTLLEENAYFNNKRIVRSVFNKSGFQDEMYSYYENGHIESFSKTITKLQKGFGLSFSPEGEFISLSFYSIGNKANKFKPNQKPIGNFVQMHPNGHVYTTSQKVENRIFNLYDTSGILIYVVDFNKMDTLFRISDHKNYYLPTYE